MQEQNSLVCEYAQEGFNKWQRTSCQRNISADKPSCSPSPVYKRWVKKEGGVKVWWRRKGRDAVVPGRRNRGKNTRILKGEIRHVCARDLIIVFFFGFSFAGSRPHRRPINLKGGNRQRFSQIFDQIPLQQSCSNFLYNVLISYCYKVRVLCLLFIEFRYLYHQFYL